DNRKLFYIAEAQGWLQDGTYAGQTFQNIQLTDILLEQPDLWDTDWSYSNLKGLYIEGGALVGAAFKHANLKHACFLKADLYMANFDHANMVQGMFMVNWNTTPNASYISANGADLEETILVGGWRYGSFKNANMRNTWLHEVRLNNSTFLGANLDGVKNDWVQWGEDTIMPNGEPYHIFTPLCLVQRKRKNNDPTSTSNGSRSQYGQPRTDSLVEVVIGMFILEQKE
ncbi:MAG: pentapeptide repeat-containing protein, partial [Anaerolineae bacterium]|nr:pentapeptide repeat-containing protein [Anaerolineae bacterium]